MKNIKQLKAHCEKVFNQRIKDAKKATHHLNSRGLRVEATAATLKARIKELEKARKAALARIDAAALDTIKSVNICVEWKKSRTWGYNPTVEIETHTTNGNFHYTKGKASGCGYDKESAAIAEALQGLAVYDNLIFNNYRKNKDKSHPFYYGKNDALPFLEVSGCGVGVLARWVKMSGYKWTECHGKNSDYYTITK